MPKPDDNTRLLHIVEAAGTAIQFTKGKTSDDLGRDEMLSLALVRLLEIIGEAAKGVTDECRGRHPEIPWSSMSAMRNRLIHGYFDVDQALVWQTVARELPPLVAQVRQALKSESNSSDA